MITSETPYKLAEIIRDTWPQLYRKVDGCYSESVKIKSNKSNSFDKKV